MGVCRSTPPFQTQKLIRKADSKALARRFMFFKKGSARLYALRRRAWKAHPPRFAQSLVVRKRTRRQTLKRAPLALNRLRSALSLLAKAFLVLWLVRFFSLGLIQRRFAP